MRQTILHGALKVRLPLLHEAFNTLFGILAPKQPVKQPALQQMRFLWGACRSVNHILHHPRRDIAHIHADILGNLQRRGENLLGGDNLTEQSVEELMVGWVYGTCSCQMQRLGRPNQSRQEEAAAGFETEAPSAKDETDPGFGTSNADIGGEGHSDADADGVAVDGRDDGLVASVHGDGDAAASVTVKLSGGRDALRRGEVHSGAKHLVLSVGGGEDDGFDAGVEGEGVEDVDEIVGHDVCEAIAVRRTVEFDDDDWGWRGRGWRVMGDEEGWEAELFVGFW